MRRHKEPSSGATDDTEFHHLFCLNVRSSFLNLVARWLAMLMSSGCRVLDAVRLALRLSRFQKIHRSEVGNTLQQQILIHSSIFFKCSIFYYSTIPSLASW